MDTSLYINTISYYLCKPNKEYIDINHESTDCKQIGISDSGLCD